MHIKNTAEHKTKLRLFQSSKATTPPCSLTTGPYLFSPVCPRSLRSYFILGYINFSPNESSAWLFTTTACMLIGQFLSSAQIKFRQIADKISTVKLSTIQPINFDCCNKPIRKAIDNVHTNLNMIT